MDLSGRLLIAMPGLGDPRFEKSVVLMCRHSAQAAMGLIVNKPRPEIGFLDLLDQLGIARTPAARVIPVHFGGPVEHGRGFVLHSGDFDAGSGTMQVPGGFALTATQEVLEQLAAGFGPSRALLALGYAGWGPGQLESEIARNDWLIADATPDLVFADDNSGKWAGALKPMGIDPLTLSATAGRA
ncbi:MAG: YqgE/AlgH family protein [Gemmobacter sp.]